MQSMYLLIIQKQMQTNEKLKDILLIIQYCAWLSAWKQLVKRKRETLKLGQSRRLPYDVPERGFFVTTHK